ncbi:MAG: pentapeptide repeat-containing protein [Rhodospirillales bacterium]|nr:pentapeptide repeat-containing protein [Rhodospirillales bacterium]
MGWKETKERCHGFRRAAGAWLGRNWMWVAGGATLVLSLCLLYPAYLDYLVIVEEKDRVEALRNLALAGAALIGGSWGFILAIWRTRSQQQAADAASYQADSTEQKRVSETFANAIELLGSESLAQRLGAIHTLGRLAHQNQELHVPIMELLTSFIREHAPWPLEEGQESPEKPRADVQETVKVLGRRNVAFDPEGFLLDLRNCDLQQIEMRNLNLAGADLTMSNFLCAQIASSDLSRVKGASIHFTKANIRSSKIDNSEMIDSWFDGAGISDVSFRNTSLQSAYFRDCKFHGTLDVRGANMASWEHLDPKNKEVFISDDKTIWPEGFTPPSKDAPAS